MSPDLSTIRARVARLHAQSAGDESPALPAEVEDALTEGYARALDGDSWSLRAEQRLHELMIRPGASREVLVLASEHERFQQELVALRRALSELWRDRDRLCADRRTPSA